jgi:cyclic pyranopterin monophosphate synthase
VTDFSHLTGSGEVHMVDVGKKDITDRLAVAECLVKMSERTSEALFGGSLPKGDALASVRLAGIMGAKQTSSLIPLCHPISIDGIEVLVERSEGGARIEATVRTSGRTGVEMEALTAVSVAGLALYDMVKGTEREVEIGPIRLLFKGGGRSGEWKR